MAARRTRRVLAGSTKGTIALCVSMPPTPLPHRCFVPRRPPGADGSDAERRRRRPELTGAPPSGTDADARDRSIAATGDDDGDDEDEDDAELPIRSPCSPSTQKRCPAASRDAICCEIHLDLKSASARKELRVKSRKNSISNTLSLRWSIFRPACLGLARKRNKGATILGNGVDFSD